MATDKQITANRKNSEKSPGPGNTISTRFNAQKHGLLASGVTELDDAEGYQQMLADLMREKNPVGVIETYRVKCIALDIVRLTRAQRLEAEYITAQLNPATFESESEKDSLQALVKRTLPKMLDPGIPVNLRFDIVQHLVTIFQRYEGFFANDLSRNERELERSQRMRLGERLPAPAALEAPVRAGTETIESAGAGPLDGSAMATLPETLPSPLPKANPAEELPGGAVVAASPCSPSASVDHERNSAPKEWRTTAPKPIGANKRNEANWGCVIPSL